MNFELVENRLAYKRRTDTEISIRPIWSEERGESKDGKQTVVREGQQTDEPQKISLEYMCSADELELVNFTAVP